MDSNRKRLIKIYRMEVEAAASVVFPLLCPVREYDWIPHWRCELLHSESGVAELGCVFTTDFDDGFGREVWVVCHYEPNRKICFVRGGELRTMRYEITLEEKDNSTNLVWKQELTGLNEEGDSMVQGYADETFGRQMAVLERMLVHFIRNGRVLALAEV